MNSIPRNRFSLFVHAALASTILFVPKLATAALTPITTNSNSGVVSPVNGYDFQADNINFTIIDGDNIGTSAGVSIDNTPNVMASTMTFDGSSIVEGTVGPTNPIATLSLTGNAASTVTFQGDMFISQAVNLSNGGNAVLANNVNLDGNIDNTQGTAGMGTLIFQGNSLVQGTIGTTNPLALITVNANSFANATVQLQSPEVNATTINLVGATTTLLLNEASMILTANLTTAINNTNTVNVLNATSLTGNVGTGTNAFNLLQVGANTDLVINGSIFATSTTFQSNKQLTVGAASNPAGTDSNITGNVNTLTASTGTLQFAGNSTVSGTIGNGNALSQVILDGAGSLVNLNGNVTATNGVVFGTDSSATTTLTLGDTVTVNGNIDNATVTPDTGLLQFAGGGTVNGDIGSSLPLSGINFLGNSKDVNISGNVDAATLTFQGTTTTDISGNITGNVNFNADGSLIVNDTKTLTGNVDNTFGTPVGTLFFVGSSVVTGTVGATNAIKDITVDGPSPAVVEFQQDVSSNSVTIDNTGTAKFDGNLTGNGLFNEDGTITIADTFTLTGNVDSSVADTGTLTLEGAGTVTGTIGATEALKLLNLNEQNAAPNNVVTLEGATVNAKNIQVFDDGATPTTLVLNNASMVLTTDAINNTTPNLNILDIQNAQTLNGEIGDTNPFALVKVGANGNTTINGDIFAVNTQFQGNNTLTLGSPFDIFGNVTTLTNNTGNLTLLGTSTVTGTIGAPGLALNTLTTNNPGNIIFNQPVYVTNYVVAGTGTTNFEDNVTTNVVFTQDGTVTLADNKTLTGTVDNASGNPNIGTFEFVGSGTVTGSMGSTNPLKLIEVNSGGTANETATLTGAVINAQTININDDGATASTLLLNNPLMVLTGAITATTPNLDILNILNAATLNTTGIGTAASPLALIQVVQNAPLTLGGNIFAKTTQLQANNALSLSNGTVINGNIDTTAANQGTLNVLGNATVTGTIGNANPLNTINLSGNGSVVNFQGNVKVGPGNLNFAPGASQLTTLNLSDGVSITGNVNNTTGTDAQGILQFLGNGSVSGTIGNVPGPGQSLYAVNLLGAAGKVVTLNQVNATSINVLNTGTLNLNASSTANVNFSNNGIVNLADNQTLTGSVDNISGVPGTGVFNFVGSGSVTGNMGFTNSLNQITVNSAGGVLETVTLTGGTINAQTIFLNDTGTQTTLVLNNPAMNLTGNITAQNNNIDQLNILNATSLTGNIGAAGKALNLIDVGQNGNTTINGNIFSTLTEFQGNNTLFLGTNSNVTGNIDSAAPDTGTLTFLGNSFVTGTIGATNPLQAINVTGGAGTTVNLQSNVFVGPGDLNFAPNAQASTLLVLNNGVTVTGNIDNTTGMNNIGTIQFKGNGGVTGTIGASNSVYAINLTGGAGTVVDLLENVNVGTGNLNFAPGATPTTELDLADGVTVTGNIDNTTGVNGNGIVEFLGNGTVTGTMGQTNGLNLINLNGGPGKVVNFVNSVTANGINFTADGAATFGNNFNLNAPVTTTANNQGTVTFLGNATINQQIGAAGFSLKGVNFNGVGSTVTLNQDIFATNSNINAGTLVSNGDQTITGNLNVNNGGTLRIAPDNAPLDVVGNFNLNAGSTLNVNLKSQLATEGFVKATKAFIDPAAHLTLTNTPAIITDGIYKYVIVNGGPGSVINALPVSGDSLLLTFETIADNINHDLLLEIISRPLTDFANQSNNIGVAGALDLMVPPPSGTLGEILSSLSHFQDAGALNRDLAALSPVVDGSVFDELTYTELMVYDAVKERLRNLKKAKPMSIHNPNILSGFASGDGYYNGRATWGKIFARASHQDMRQGVEGYQDHMFGFALGTDVMLSESSLVGAAASWADLNIQHAVSDSQTRVYSYQAGVYGQHEFNEQWFLNWEGSFAYNDYDTQYNFQFSDNLFFSPSADYSGYMFGAKGEVGYEYICRMVHVIPVASLFYSYLDLSSYTENGMGNANQFVDSTEFNLLRGGLGVRVGLDFPYTKNQALIVLEPEAHVMAYYDFTHSKMDVTSQFVGAGPSFVTSGFDPVRDSYNVGASISTFGNNSNFIFTVSYDYQWKTEYTAHNGFFRARYEW